MIKLEDVYEIDYQEFETIVQVCLGIKDYDFVADVETNNNTDHVYRNISGQDEFWLKEADEHLSNKSTWFFPTRGILEILVLYEVLPPGTFIINVCW